MTEHEYIPFWMYTGVLKRALVHMAGCDAKMDSPVILRVLKKNKSIFSTLLRAFVTRPHYTSK